MIFNSYLFLLVFLPVVLAGYYLLQRRFESRTPSYVWLIVASLVFYASLDPRYLVILVVSVGLNFLVVSRLARPSTEGPGRRRLFVLALLANLLFLGYFKYTGFVVDSINGLAGTNLTVFRPTYPTGMSFFTFIQIGCLVEAYAGQVERLSFLKYALFGSFFPYVTSGPIVRQAEIFRQMDLPAGEQTGRTPIAVGLTLFAMGLFKKVVLADNIAPFVTTLFGAAAAGTATNPTNAWIGVLAYTLELYFDFSGYSDMAIGLGCMFGIRLPLNFNSPLKATSMVDFWRRWHMTMVRFFTSHVYTPITVGLMRRSIRLGIPRPVRTLAALCIPVFITFVLVGLWHGATWGFVVSGAIHGGALATNLAWRELRARISLLPSLPSLLGWALTMLVVVVANVFLRADSVQSAFHVLGMMFGLASAAPATVAQFYGTASLLGSFTVVPAVIWLLVLAAIALLFPRNSQQILGRYPVALPSLASPDPDPGAEPRIDWRPSLRWATAMAALGGVALTSLGGQSPFLYYQF
jgi:D-alanyl-lipoteichoic acid acyltransferase DltB (MBOAT superfamily)